MNTKRNKIITTVCVICIMLSILLFILIKYSTDKEEFVYNQHLDELAVTVKAAEDDKLTVDIDMQEMAYYIINVEGNINQMAYQYRSSDLNAYWSLKIETTYTMRDYAKDWAMDSCVRDNVYYLEALKNNMTLTEEEEKLASEDAQIIMKNLTGRQMDVSDFSQEVLYNIEKKIYLATKYVNFLNEEGYTMEELELSGSYYEELLKSYETVVNDELWEKVKLGNLTVKTKD